MVREIRKGNGRHGLVLANGGLLSYQHVVCLSSKPRNDGSPYPDTSPLPDLVKDVPVPTVDPQAEGEATIEVSLAGSSPRNIRIYAYSWYIRRTRSSLTEMAHLYVDMLWVDCEAMIIVSLRTMAMQAL